MIARPTRGHYATLDTALSFTGTSHVQSSATAAQYGNVINPGRSD